ncbi:MAG: DNA repair protein RecO [Methyloprofundus sp.]|nr:DNA repair protein RecO [Methyloprofundus sp.]
MALALQAGFLLHQYDYQDSSLILDVFTHVAGRVSVVAKGVKQQKSPYLGLLRPFVPINISYFGTGSLKTLGNIEQGNAEFILAGNNTYCGFYLNELIRYLIPSGEPYPDVFVNYLSCLQVLKTSHKVESALRTFEIQLIQSLGYGLNLECDVITGKAIQAEENYRYMLEQGATLDCAGALKGTTLIAMHRQSYSEQSQLNQAKWLMRQVIDFHLQGKILHSRQLISKFKQTSSCKIN